MDVDMISGGNGARRRRTLGLCSPTNYCTRYGWLTRTMYRQLDAAKEGNSRNPPPPAPFPWSFYSYSL